MKQEYRNKIDFIKETVRDVLDEFVKHHRLHYEDLAPYNWDFNGLAKSISNSNNWENYYRNIFKHNLQVRQYLFEMCDTRHQFSHRDGNKELNEEDVFRTANTANMLLNSIDLDAAKAAKEKILEIEQTYGSRLYGENDAHQHLTNPDKSRTQIDVREAQEEVAQENEIQEVAETTTETAAASELSETGNVENTEHSLDDFIQQSKPMETAARVTEERFQLYETTRNNDTEENSSENEVNRDNDKPRRNFSPRNLLSNINFINIIPTFESQTVRHVSNTILKVFAIVGIVVVIVAIVVAAVAVVAIVGAVVLGLESLEFLNRSIVELLDLIRYIWTTLTPFIPVFITILGVLIVVSIFILIVRRRRKKTRWERFKEKFGR